MVGDGGKSRSSRWDGSAIASDGGRGEGIRNPERWAAPSLPTAARFRWTQLPVAQSTPARGIRRALLSGALLLLCLAAALSARANVGATGEVVDVAPVELLTKGELQELVGPIALYPDDLLAIVLPAATYPLQVVLAARYLEEREADPGLKPDPDWDASIVALLNYPEVLALLDRELNWTWRLGEAVLLQQQDVIAAVGEFREQAADAGNLQSDEKQNVSVTAAGTSRSNPWSARSSMCPITMPRRWSSTSPGASTTTTRAPIRCTTTRIQAATISPMALSGASPRPSASAGAAAACTGTILLPRPSVLRIFVLRSLLLPHAPCLDQFPAAGPVAAP